MEEQPTLRPVGELSRHDALQRDTSRYTLTIKQASELFASIGVPRSPRSVQRFCERGNVDCIRVKGEKTEHYFVEQASVERYAEELRQLENLSHIDDDMSRYVATQHDTTRHSATPPEASELPKDFAEIDQEEEVLRSRIDVLEKEKLQLQIDRAAKEQVIGQMIDERRSWLYQITEQSRELGRMEMQIQQLAAPKEDLSRHDATEVVTIVVDPNAPESDVLSGESQANLIPEPEQPKLKRSFLRGVFGN